jgi:O-antigen/teichoic acid export membrane protein
MGVDPSLSSNSRGSGFAKSTMILFSVTVIGGVCNYLYQVFMMKSLTVENYAELSAVLSLFYIVSMPAQTVATMLTRYSSKFIAEGREAQVPWLVKRSLWISLAVSLVAVAILYLSMPWLVNYLSLTSDLPLLIMLAGLVVAMMTQVGYGIGQGLQRFNVLSLHTLVWPVGKLLFGVILVVAGFGVAGAMGGVIVGMTFGVLILLLGVKDHLVRSGSPITKDDARSIKVYLIPVAVAVICYGVLTNMDIFLANHYLDKGQAGLYSTASTLGKIILFLPGAIGTVMFPKITHAHTRNEDTVRIMRRSIFWNLALTGLVALGFLLLPDLVLKILSNDSYIAAAPSLQVLGIAMMFFGLASLFMNYGLATNRHQYIAVILVFTLAEIALVMLFHSSPFEIACDMLVTSLSMCLLSYAYMEYMFRTETTY